MYKQVLLKVLFLRNQSMTLVFSAARAQREQNAHQMHTELESGLERWRVQCATLQHEAAMRAETRATQQNRERQQRAEAANRAREEHHNLLMTRYIINIIKFWA
jgi:hypothetical protein